MENNESSSTKIYIIIFSIFSTIVLIWLAMTSFYQIPRAINEAVGRTEISSGISLDKLSTNIVLDCKKIRGKCGNGMYKRETYYFDRVGFQCPDTSPFLKSFKFERCGKQYSVDEGLLIYAQCCQIVIKNE